MSNSNLNERLFMFLYGVDLHFRFLTYYRHIGQGDGKGVLFQACFWYRSLPLPGISYTFVTHLVSSLLFVNITYKHPTYKYHNNINPDLILLQQQIWNIMNVTSWAISLLLLFLLVHFPTQFNRRSQYGKLEIYITHDSWFMVHWEDKA